MIKQQILAPLCDDEELGKLAEQVEIARRIYRATRGLEDAARLRALVERLDQLTEARVTRDFTEADLRGNFR